MAKRTIEDDELEDIEKRLAQISEKRDGLNAEAAKLIERRTVLEATSGIAAAIANMSPADKAAIFQEIRAQGIESGEAVGSPGA